MRVIDHLIHAAGTTLEAAADFVAPRRCLACNAPAPQWRAPICADCQHELATLRIPSEMQPALRGVPPAAQHVDAFHVLYAYREQGAVRALIHSMKYRGAQQLCIRVGTELGASIAMEMREHIDLLVPVPIHAARLRERRYNQSERLVHGMVRAIGVPLELRLLHRARKTPPQAFLGSEERAANMRDAFVIRGAVRRGATVGVLDDVVTTGATVDACAIALKRAGAGRVVVFAVAMAQAEMFACGESQPHVAEMVSVG